MKNLSKNIFIITSLAITGGCAVVSTGLSPKSATYQTNTSNQEQVSVFLDSSVIRPNGQTSVSLLVAHALGSVDIEGNGTGTNSLEAFVDSYEAGFRLFEADLSLTKDNKVVVFHRLAEELIGYPVGSIENITVDQFKSRKYADTYTLLDADDLLKLLTYRKDAYVVTDIKSDFEATLKQLMSNEIIKENPEIADRIIVQFYNPQQFEFIKENYNFKNIMFSLYQVPEMSNEDIINFVTPNSEIDAVTMWWDERYTPELREKLHALGRGVYVHTVNDMTQIQQFISHGVGVYTDTLDVKEYFDYQMML